MASSKRIYVVTENGGEKPVQRRMVKATTAAQAIRHVVEPRFTAEVADPEQCAELGAAGVKVEDAGNAE